MTVLLLAVIPANAKAAPIGYYDIKFDKNGIAGVTVPTDFVVKDGALYGLPSQLPTRANYKFLGYDTSTAANTVRYTAGQGNLRASSSLTLYPVWQPVKTSSGVSTFNYGTHLDAPKAASSQSNKPCKVQMYYVNTQKSFSFGGWAVHDQGIKGYAYQLAGPGFTAGMIKSFSWTTRGDVATNSPDVRKSLGVSTKASFNNCGYSGVVDMSKLKTGDYKLTIYGVPNAGANFAVCEISFNIRPAGTAYVLFNANGGKGVSNGKQLVTYGANNKLNPPSFTRSGYFLMGFSKTKNATKAEYELNKAYSFSGISNNTTLYAVWGYKVVIDANGGTFHNGKTRVEYIFSAGTTQVIDFNMSPYDQYLIWYNNSGKGLGKALEKPGYEFTYNYSTDPNAKSPGFNRYLRFEVKSNTTLYAVWRSTISKGGIWYRGNAKNKGYANVVMYVDKANANKFADELQSFILLNESRRNKISEKDHAIADLLFEICPFAPATFVYDCIRYDVGTALDNLATDLVTGKASSFSELTKIVKNGYDYYNVASLICEKTALTINVGNDKTFKRNYDLLKEVYNTLVSQGVYSGKNGKANVNGSICLTIDTGTSALVIDGKVITVLKNFGIPVIGENGIDYHALLKYNGGHWIDEKYLQKEDPLYNPENDTLFSALYKVLSLTDGSQKISGPEVKIL